jgi:MFS family permease
LIWSAALVSNIGSWMQTVGVGILVTQMTGRAGWTGLVAAAAFVPIGFLSPVGGAMADRVDRKKWFLATTLGETVFATVLAILVATGHHTPALVTLTVFGGGICTALGFPAYQAIMPDIVPREDLLAAAALGATQYNFGRVVGPALTGVILYFTSFSVVFTINAISFGAVIIALLLVRLPDRSAPADEGRLVTRIATGIRGAWSEPGCRAAIGLIGATALFLSPFIALIPAVALKLLHEGSRGTSVLVTAQGIGAVTGALALTPLANRFGRRRVLLADLGVVLPATLFLYALAPSLATASVALMAVGAAYIGVLSGLMTVVQLRAPVALRARILSIYMVALGSIYPLAAVMQGWLGDRVGLRIVTASTAAIFAVGLLAVRATRPQLLHALEEPVEEAIAPVALPIG